MVFAKRKNYDAKSLFAKREYFAESGSRISWSK